MIVFAPCHVDERENVENCLTRHFSTLQTLVRKHFIHPFHSQSKLIQSTIIIFFTLKKFYNVTIQMKATAQYFHVLTYLFGESL